MITTVSLRQTLLGLLSPYLGQYRFPGVAGALATSPSIYVGEPPPGVTMASLGLECIISPTPSVTTVPFDDGVGIYERWRVFLRQHAAAPITPALYAVMRNFDSVTFSPSAEILTPDRNQVVTRVFEIMQFSLLEQQS